MSVWGDVDEMLLALAKMRPLSERERDIARIFTSGCSEFYPFDPKELSGEAREMLLEIEEE